MSKLDDTQAERLGSRLRKLVSEARSGNSEVPQQVAYVSVEPLTHRAIERSSELIQAHGWHHLICRSALLMMVLCLIGCTATTSIDLQKLPTFGDSLPGTIHVTALQGFKQPGHYHLPAGATLGLLVDVAGFEPASEPFWVRAWVGHLLVIRNDKSARSRDRNIWTDDEISKAARELRLLEGDRIRTDSIVW
ncbi:MAG TPA: hypothetical protein DDZ88_08890 [Verrucomicrobiales bacterium]|nr:hypothetical protein [Verrucomicrobiales bacterium]